MGEKSEKFVVVLATSTGWFSSARKPLKKKYEGLDWSQRSERDGVERIQVIEEEGNTERFQQLAGIMSEQAIFVLIKGCTHVKTPGSDSVSCQPLESSSLDIVGWFVKEEKFQWQFESERDASPRTWPLTYAPDFWVSGFLYLASSVLQVVYL